MSLPPLVGDQEVYSLSPSELRFRQACQFYALFKTHHGPAAGLKDKRFYWMCYADAFLMSIVSLKDLMRPKPLFNKSDTFRFVTVMRNVTVHQAVVSGSSPLLMVNKIIVVHVGAPQPNAPDHDEPVLVADRVAAALANYETQLRAAPRGMDKKTGQPKTMWDYEQSSVGAARRWNALLAAKTPPQVPLSAVFLEVIRFVAGDCGFTVPPLP